MTSLVDASTGTHGRLAEIGGERSFRRRLMEMGLLPGTPIRVVRRANIEGLVEIEVRGCHLTLRKSEASALLLQS
ncbi:MAG TPA: FeoA family protein [Candidatus Krumholzibacteria bacterium]|nr:FeoA family protein [Candidatus Krumholzibacteria bacterium]